MNHTKYLIIGGSHAALSALDAIRRHDGKGSVTLVSREKRAPYSPTVLPYVISGESGADAAAIRDPGDFTSQGIQTVEGASLVGVDPENATAKLDNGDEIRYEKLLLATGARAHIPPIPGIEQTACRVIRTMDDAVQLKEAMADSQSAVIVGAGFIGMHAAENLARAGISVTVLESVPHILPASFDSDTADLIQGVFEENGVRIRTGARVVKARPDGAGAVLVLEGGEEVAGDILLLATGIRPNIDFLSTDTGIETDLGILVDDTMKTSAENIWAAGDVAQSSDFFSRGTWVGGTIPCATRQGRTAGMDMAKDPYLKGYSGNLNMNTFSFFGNHAFSVGIVASSDPGNGGVETGRDKDAGSFHKFVFEGDVLTGVSSVNERLDPGILKELILQKTDLSEVKDRFLTRPRETGRILMTKLWR